MDADTALTEKLAAILPHLNEKQRRLLLAVEARTLGHGGISRVARAWLSFASNHPESSTRTE